MHPGCRVKHLTPCIHFILTDKTIMLPIKPMLAGSCTGDFKPGTVWAVEPKLDGIRVIVTINPSQGWVTYETRNGNALTSLNKLTPALLTLGKQVGRTFCLDCEALAQGDFFTGVGELMKKTGEAELARLAVFDLPAIEDHIQGDEVPWTDRRQMLQSIFTNAGQEHLAEQGVLLVPVFEVTDAEAIDPQALLDQAIGLGWEGVMLKNIHSPYSFGKRTKAWLKLKASETYDCTIIGFTPGKGRYDGAAGAMLVYHCGTVVAVGSGLDDALRLDLHDNPGKYVGKVAEVTCQQLTPSGSMRHPSLVCIRWDK